MTDPVTPEEHVPPANAEPLSREEIARIPKDANPLLTVSDAARWAATIHAQAERIEKLTEGLREAYPWIAAWNRPEADGLLERIAEYVDV